jgi:3-phenylpropionate/cinnamic acid dioxygenase small subunit
MASSEVQIANLLYRYAEYIDGGDLEGAAALFTEARVMTGLGEIGWQELLAMWRRSIKLYDGVPRTKHVITNPIIEVDEAAGIGSSRSTYTVIQQAGNGPLQPVICGRYHDKFKRGEDGEWRYSYRDYSLIDLIGDMSGHAPHWADNNPSHPAAT